MSLTCSDDYTLSDIFRLLAIESGGNVGLNCNLLDESVTPYVSCEQAETNQDIIRNCIEKNESFKLNFFKL
jgi:hypothetical protein